MPSMFRAAALSSLFLLLPYSEWIDLKFEDRVPLGTTNLILIWAAVLWLWGKVGGSGHGNPFRAYSVFLLIAILWIGVALTQSFGLAEMESLTLAKREVSLMFLYFVPIAFMRDEDDFKWVFAASLAVSTMIGLHTLSTGVLGGANFNDSKRGYGPFGTNYWGSDVAGAFLAQALMFFLGVILTDGFPFVFRLASAAGGGIIFLGILATYSRGSLAAGVVGAGLLLIVRRFNPKALILATVLAIAASFVVPQSVLTRLSGTTDSSGELDESSRIRFLYSEAAWTIFKDHPLGVGTGQVRAAMSQYVPGLATDDLHGWGAYVDPHNGFLYALVSWGVLGFIPFLWMLGSVFRGGARLAHDEDAPLAYRAYGLGTCGFIGCCAVCNLFYANFFKDLILGSLCLFLGVTAFAVADRRAAEEPEAEAVTEPAA
jgi:O-antigen ligase